MWWLSPAQKEHARHRIRSNQTNTHEVHEWKWSQARECLTDPQVWLATIVVLVMCLVNGGITSFQAQIIKGLGFSSLTTILLQIPQSVFAVLCFIVAITVNVNFQRTRLIQAAVWPVFSMISMIVAVALPAEPRYKVRHAAHSQRAQLI